MTLRLALAALAALALAPTAAAQEISGWDGAPYAGTLALDAGFSGDPRTVDVRPGGARANPLSGSGCVGYISTRPDVVVDYDAGSFDLTFSAASDTDINLVVRTPSGRYLCDDDSGDGLNPVVTVDRPRSGEYTVWVGVFAQSGEYVDGVLGVSEVGNEVSMADYGGGGGSGGGGTEIPGWSDDAYFGEVALRAGFSDDPRLVEVQAGGAQANPLSGLGCVGYIGLAPDLIVDYDAGSFDLTFSVASDTDVNLVVRDPFGDYHCDDDSGEGLNARLTIDDPASGGYTVWAGVYGESSEYVDAVIGVSEVGSEATANGRSSGGQTGGGRASGREVPGWDEEPYFGVTRLDAGFSNDPRTVRINAGGAQPNPLDGAGCVGHIGLRPDHVLDYDAGSLDLTLSAASDSDVNLVVRTPSGRYLCDDDSGEGLNPRITISNPRSGDYIIWVGTFSDRDGSTVASTFAISELGREAR